MSAEVTTLPEATAPKKNKGGRPRKRPIESAAIAVPDAVPVSAPKKEPEPSAVVNIVPGSVGAVQEQRNAEPSVLPRSRFWWLLRAR